VRLQCLSERGDVYFFHLLEVAPALVLPRREGAREVRDRHRVGRVGVPKDGVDERRVLSVAVFEGTVEDRLDSLLVDQLGRRRDIALTRFLWADAGWRVDFEPVSLLEIGKRVVAGKDGDPTVSCVDKVFESLVKGCEVVRVRGGVFLVGLGVVRVGIGESRRDGIDDILREHGSSQTWGSTDDWS